MDGSRHDLLSRSLRRFDLLDQDGVEDDTASWTASLPPRWAQQLPDRPVSVTFQVDASGARLGDVLQLRRIRWSEQDGTVTIEAGATAGTVVLHAPRDASWTGQTLGAIAQAIAGRGGLTAVVAGELASVVPMAAVQAGESDFTFIRRIARDAGGRAVAKAGRLVVMAAQSTAGAGSGVQLPAVMVADRNIDTSEGAFTLPYRGRAQARYRDQAGDIQTVSAGADDGQTAILPLVYPDRATARGAAEAALTTPQREVVITAALDPAIRPLHPLQIDSNRIPAASGEGWTIATVRHRVADGRAPTTVFRAVSGG